MTIPLMRAMAMTAVMIIISTVLGQVVFQL